ncbi:MAG TPA: hypothetical protein VIQ51_03705 [Chryseosolibacter sp.]
MQALKFVQSRLRKFTAFTQPVKHHRYCGRALALYQFICLEKTDTYFKILIMIWRRPIY